MLERTMIITTVMLATDGRGKAGSYADDNDLMTVIMVDILIILIMFAIIMVHSDNIATNDKW